MAEQLKWTQISRRNFFKTTALAGLAATLPTTGFAGQNVLPAGGTRPSPAGKKRNLVFLSDAPENYKRLVTSIKSIREYKIQVIEIKTNLNDPEAVLKSIREKNADIILMSLPAMGFATKHISEGMNNLDIPVILLPLNLDLIMREADLATAFRLKGINALLASSEKRAIELIKAVAAPRILEGKKALIFGRRFDSTSVPVFNLNEDYVYRHTGVRVEYRSIDELKKLVKKGVDEAAVRKEMEKWKKGAVKISGATDKMIFDCSKMYVLLKSLVEKEGLSAVSIDCLSFSFSPDTAIPLPCLAFTRLRDEGITAACEADLCMMLSSMLMQEVSGRPSFQSNVSSVNHQTSSVVFRHCVVPTKIFGPDAPQQPYNIQDYHGMGKGAVPEIEYPVDLDITTGGFTKDLKNFVLWYGKIIPGINDKATPSFKDAPPEMQKMRKYCSNRAEVKIKDTGRFIQNIAGIHHIVVAGKYGKELHDTMLRMNVNVVTSPDLVMSGVS
ncbi:MAG: twin-arginine translocation signal domain-containing protein [Desulfobacteraceae bacterium]|jgi:hypothetical protein